MNNCIFRYLIFLSLLFVLAVAKAEAPSWFDQSHNIFVPEQAKSDLIGIREFPVFWWNFIILQTNQDKLSDIGLQDIQQRCRDFAMAQAPSIEKISCGFQIGMYTKLLNQWAQDYPRRHDAPSQAKIESAMSLALAKASLPLPKELLQFLRVDPLNSIGEFQNILQSHSLLKFEQHEGVYFDPVTRRALIAIQFSFSPAQTSRTAQEQEPIKMFCHGSQTCQSAHLLGPHASTFENETQIRKDLGVVSWFGTALMLGFILLVVGSGRGRLVLMVPPLLVAVGLSTLLTVLVFGRIHGLTLSFGPGIVGLCMHYGLQAAFSFGNEKRIWRANFFGVLTTLAILLAVVWSQIPLIQQIMFFSSAGLMIGFGFFYFLHRRFPNLLKAKPVHIRLPQIKALQFFMLGVAVFSAVGFFALKINFGIQELNFESAENSVYSHWLYKSMGMSSPLVHFFDPEKPRLGAEASSILVQTKNESEWAVKNQIKLSSVNEFLPIIEEQKRHLTTWQILFCRSSERSQFSPTEKKFFAPFLKNLECHKLDPVDLKTEIPEYLKDFSYEKKWLTLWAPQNEVENSKIKAQFPGASSLLEIISSFPKVLSHELLWMVPLAFFLAFILLVIYCGGVGIASIALIPFFTGTGLFYIAAFIGHWSITFISFIGFIKVFGFSLDYGIFVTDVLVEKDQALAEGVWSALGLNSISTTLGFLPLIFCSHPVLKQLGQVLVFGSIGSYLGAVWGLTPFSHFIARRRA